MPDVPVGVGCAPHRESHRAIVVHVQAGSPPPPRLVAVVGIAAPPAARA
ncbi:hypothetical protein [Trinickia sp.]